LSVAVWAGIAALGAVGAVLRVVLTSAVARRARGSLPIGTLAVNMAGALGLGLLVGLSPSSDVLRLVGTGLLASFTTFSTWMLEARRLAAEGRRGHTLALLLGSLVVGLVLYAAGHGAGAALS
jgi:CrcB protein